jgi:hypothetical protein
MHTSHCQKCRCFDGLKLFAQRLEVFRNTVIVFILVAFFSRRLNAPVICVMLQTLCYLVLANAVLMTDRLADCSGLLHEMHLVLRLAFCCCSSIIVSAKISIWRSSRTKWVYFIFIALHFFIVHFNIIYLFLHRCFEQFVALRVSNKTVCCLFSSG